MNPPIPVPFIDPKAQAGKFQPPSERFDLVVIGAGPAGLAAAVEAARGGLSVKLVDENPVGIGLVGLDVPQYFGGRATAAVGNPERMVEQLFATNPGLEEAFESGVDVALGTMAWGVFVEGPGLRSLPEPVVGLADETRAWTVGFSRLIVATGARDLVVFFPGADAPGVMGAAAYHALAARYDAFDGRRLVILGSGDDAVEAALLAETRGHAVAALIEVEDAVVASPAAAAKLAVTGIPVLTGHAIQRAEASPLGVTGAVAVRLADGAVTPLACDTIVLALGRIPVVDLLDAAGARLVYDESRGGHVPVLAGGVATSLPAVFAAGDCAGLCPVADPEAARASGRAAARAALASLGRDAGPVAAPPAPVAEPTEAYRFAWMRALVAVGGGQVDICRCEEVTRAELIGVRPPRYLGAAMGPACPDVRALAEDGVPDQDQIKRLTRAGMGPCQGRRCREQIAMLLALESGRPLGAIPLAGYRAPVRPLPLAVLAEWEETAAMTEDWDVWFGIPAQWVPDAAIGTAEEADYLGRNIHL